MSSENIRHTYLAGPAGPESGIDPEALARHLNQLDSFNSGNGTVGDAVISPDLPRTPAEVHPQSEEIVATGQELLILLSKFRGLCAQSAFDESAPLSGAATHMLQVVGERCLLFGSPIERAALREQIHRLHEEAQAQKAQKEVGDDR